MKIRKYWISLFAPKSLRLGIKTGAFLAAKVRKGETRDRIETGRLYKTENNLRRLGDGWYKDGVLLEVVNYNGGGEWECKEITL